MKIQVGNGTYEVDDSFANLPEDKQNEVINEIQQQTGYHQEAEKSQMATQAKNEEINNNVGFSNPNGPVRSAIDPLMAAGGGAFDAANSFLKTPLGHATERIAEYGIPGYLISRGINKSVNAINSRPVPTVNINQPGGFNANGMPASGPGSAGQPIGGSVAPSTAPSVNPEAAQGINNALRPGVASSVPPTGTAAAEAVDHNGIISKIAELYKTYGPALADHLTAAGKAISETGAGRALGTVARIAGSTPALGLQLATHSGELNKNEDQALAAVHSDQNQAQWKQYYEMKQRANPNLPNAFSSGFAQQLTSGTTQPQTKTGSVFDKTQ